MSTYDNFPDFISAVRSHPLDCDQTVTVHDIPHRKLFGFTCTCEESWYLPVPIFIAFRRRNGHLPTPVGVLCRSYNMEHQRREILTSLFEGFYDTIKWVSPYADEIPEPRPSRPDDPGVKVPQNVKRISAHTYQKKITPTTRGVTVKEAGYYQVRDGEPMYLSPGFYILDARGTLPKRVKYSKYMEEHEDLGAEMDEIPSRFAREEIILGSDSDLWAL